MVLPEFIYIATYVGELALESISLWNHVSVPSSVGNILTFHIIQKSKYKIISDTHTHTFIWKIVKYIYFI